MYVCAVWPAIGALVSALYHWYETATSPFAIAPDVNETVPVKPLEVAAAACAEPITEAPVGFSPKTNLKSNLKSPVNAAKVSLLQVVSCPSNHKRTTTL